MSDPNQIQELQARVAKLEAIVQRQSLLLERPGAGAGPPRTRGTRRRRARADDDAETAAASRRSLLGLLAGAGAGASLWPAASAIAAAVQPADAANVPAPGPGAWKTYVPKLIGEKANPVLGTKGGGVNGHYIQLGRLVVVKTWIQFHKEGTQPGEGQYRMTLPPVRPLLGSDAWLGPTGLAIMHRAATHVIRIAAVILPHSEFVTFQLDNVAGSVTHQSPWVWGSGDGFNTFMIYESKDEPRQ